MKENDPLIYPVFSGLVEDILGFRYESSAREILLEKLEVAAADEGFDSLFDYYYFLRYDVGGAASLQRLIEHLVVPETYFFRELPPLEWLVREILIPQVRAGERPRVWSAACSTGEEPLTLAMLLDEQDALDSVEILASDISQNCIEKAKSGCFRLRSLRDHPPEHLVKRYLTRGEKELTIERRLVDRIQWCQVNLFDQAATAAMGIFSAILCRNVLIYFSSEKIAKLVRRLSDMLSPDGILLVGVSETLFRLEAGVRCEERSGVFFYRKDRG
jgi:chemotaxis protein methyltransferase CheR